MGKDQKGPRVFRDSPKLTSFRCPVSKGPPVLFLRPKAASPIWFPLDRPCSELSAGSPTRLWLSPSALFGNFLDK